MDLGITVIEIICIAICAMPFAIIIRNRKKKEKQLLMSLKNLAKQHDCEITQHEILGYYAIGIDESKNAVSFILKIGDIVKQQFVLLSTIKKCEVVKINRPTVNKEKSIDRLNLNLSHVDKNKSDIVLEFYNSDVKYQLSGEIQSIEKWNQLINNLLNSKR